MRNKLIKWLGGYNRKEFVTALESGRNTIQIAPTQDRRKRFRFRIIGSDKKACAISTLSYMNKKQMEDDLDSDFFGHWEYHVDSEIEDRK